MGRSGAKTIAEAVRRSIAQDEQWHYSDYFVRRLWLPHAVTRHCDNYDSVVMMERMRNDLKETNRSNHLSLVVRPHVSSPNYAGFTMRNGNGLSQFSGYVRLEALHKLTQMVFDSQAGGD